MQGTAAAATKSLVRHLHTYPIKGLPPVQLPEVQLEAGDCFPADREWAIITGRNASLWDPDRPESLFVEKGLRGLHHGSKVRPETWLTEHR